MTVLDVTVTHGWHVSQAGPRMPVEIRAAFITCVFTQPLSRPPLLFLEGPVKPTADGGLCPSLQGRESEVLKGSVRVSHCLNFLTDPF